MKITIKGQIFELTLTPVLSENTSVAMTSLSFDDEMIKNIETYMKEKNMFSEKIYRHDYLDFKNTYDIYNNLSTKKLTLLFREFAKKNDYKILDFNNMGKRYFVILK